jgi:uncharacterized protein (DUF58 family)
MAWGRNGLSLLLIGFLWIIPAIPQPRFIGALVAWDVLVLAAWLVDLQRLPRAGQLRVRRTWRHPPSLSVVSHVELRVINDAPAPLRVHLLDTAPGELRTQPPRFDLAVEPGVSSDVHYDICPSRRGESHFGWAHIRYASPWRLAERWARAPLLQSVATCPDLDEAKRQTIFLIRSRQIALEKRTSRRMGAGRAFESLREHRSSDEFRDICWTATARRGKLVTRQYEIERSQTIWLVIDSGRLMRARIEELTKLDLAVNAALSLTEVALASGDQVGVLAYGRRVTTRLLPGRGREHLGRIIDGLALVKEEEWEADHVQAAGRLLADQRRRSLVVWLTDLAETAMTPEVVRAASRLTARHLVIVAAVGQPDMLALSRRRPSDVGEMFESTAAQELMQRRANLMASLRARGAQTLEVSSRRLTPALVNAYLDVKQRGAL